MSSLCDFNERREKQIAAQVKDASARIPGVTTFINMGTSHHALLSQLKNIGATSLLRRAERDVTKALGINWNPQYFTLQFIHDPNWSNEQILQSMIAKSVATEIERNFVQRGVGESEERYWTRLLSARQTLVMFARSIKGIDANQFEDEYRRMGFDGAAMSRYMQYINGTMQRGQVYTSGL